MDILSGKTFTSAIILPKVSLQVTSSSSEFWAAPTTSFSQFCSAKQQPQKQQQQQQQQQNK